MIDWTIVSARLLEFTSVSILFGSSSFYLYGFKTLPGGLPPRGWTWPHRVISAASVIALLAVISWLMAETASFSDNAKDAFDPTMLWSVVSDTRFGQISSLRIVLLAISTLVPLAFTRGRGLWATQSFLGGVVLASFAWTGHGASNDGLAGAVHLGSDVLHLLAAGVWIGALLPLGILIIFSLRTQSEIDARVTYDGLESFSGIGIAVVLILVFTGLINGLFLIGLSHWRGLFTTMYGLSLIAKVGLFGLMLLLAANNRFFLSPRLKNALPGSAPVTHALRALRMSIFIETTLAVLVLGAVALLGTLEPPISVVSMSDVKASLSVGEVGVQYSEQLTSPAQVLHRRRRRSASNS